MSTMPNNNSDSNSPQSGQSSHAHATTTTRSTAFMIEHLIAKKHGGVNTKNPGIHHLHHQAQSRDKLRRGIPAAPAENAMSDDDDDYDVKVYDKSQGSPSSHGSSHSRSGRETESPRINVNTNNSGHLSKAGAIAASVRHHVMNSYMPLELTKPGSRGHRDSPASPPSAATFSSRNQVHSPTPNSGSTSPVDLAAINASAINYYQQQQQQQSLHGGSQQYYPYAIPIPGFPSVSGAGNFGFHAGLIPPHWGNQFLTMSHESTQRQAALLLNFQHRIAAPFGVYGTSRQFNSLTPLSKRKGGQIRFTNHQTGQLEKSFQRHKYLNANDRKKLALALRLSDRQVKTWFQNRRAKWRKSKETGSYENETQVSRSSSFGAPDSPDDGRCESVTEVKIEKHQHNNARENITPIQSTSGGKIYVPSSSDQMSPEKLYRGHTHSSNSSSRGLGHNKMISCP